MMMGDRAWASWTVVWCLLVATSSLCVAVDPPRWQPRASQGLRFQYQLGEAFNVAKHVKQGVSVYFLDCADTPNATVQHLLSRGLKPVGYFSAGSWESYREDQASFPPSTLGKVMDGWPDERWVDVRSPAVRQAAAARVRACAAKGFLGVDPDNVDGYSNDSGFDLTKGDQMDFLRFLSAEAHAVGLSIGLKNGLEMVGDLVGEFDFFVNEQCAQYDECRLYSPAKSADKPVWSVEYKSAKFAAACRCQSAFSITTIYKKLKLNAWMQECSEANKRKACASAP